MGDVTGIETNSTSIATQMGSQDPPRKEPETASLAALLHARHSTRIFLPDPVPEHILTYCLRLAERAPSNSNIQPWRMKLATGAARDRIISVMSATASLHSADTDGPIIPPLPVEYNHHRSAMGRALYGPEGYDCPRHDKAKHHEIQMRNFSFFSAPVIGVVYMDAQLTHMDAMTVGMFCQSFALALVDKGLGLCWMVSVTGFEEILRREFGLGGKGEVRILCGVAIGWPADHGVNRVEMGRQGLEEFMEFLRE